MRRCRRWASAPGAARRVFLQNNKKILLLIIREAFKSRLSLGMTSNKTYHFQTTANHHRFIKVWTSISDLPTSKNFIQTFFLEKVWLRITLPTYGLYICPNVCRFFYVSLLDNFFWTLSPNHMSIINISVVYIILECSVFQYHLEKIIKLAEWSWFWNF